jgi:hypothetical protein
MTQLEQTIISSAQRHLTAVQAFYAKTIAGTADNDDRDDYQGDHAALYALLEIGHLSESGMSPEGVAALQSIENDAAAAFRASIPDQDTGHQADLTDAKGIPLNIER